MKVLLLSKTMAQKFSGHVNMVTVINDFMHRGYHSSTRRLTLMLPNDYEIYSGIKAFVIHGTVV